MNNAIHSSTAELTIDQLGQLRSGLMRLSARMSPEQIGEIADALHDIRRVRSQHMALRQRNRWA